MANAIFHAHSSLKLLNVCTIDINELKFGKKKRNG
jgi:hypothetical protein